MAEIKDKESQEGKDSGCGVRRKKRSGIVRNQKVRVLPKV